MAGYPAHEDAANILANLNEALAKAEGDNKAKIERIIADLDPIKDNRTFMRTQKAEKITTVALADSEVIKNDPGNAEKLAAVQAAVTELVERVKSMVIRMT